jgi:site-specific recombinase XerD
LNRNNRDFEEYYEGKKSKTQIAYEADLRLFFRIVRNKTKGSELEYLSFNDLELTLEDLEEFKQELCELRNPDGKYTYANKTVNRKLSAIKKFIRYMGKKKLIKDISFVNLVTSEKQKDNHYAAFDVSEVYEMAEWALNNERELGNEKRLMILFALDTCIRKSAQLRLKWSDFTVREDGVLVKGIDKGNNEFRQLISKTFYNELLTIKSDKSDRVFNISEDALNSMMKRYREFHNISDSRRLVWHSIRKSGITFRFRVTNDILEAKRAANHKSITTTQIYLQEEDYGQIGAVSSVGKLNENLYKEVDHDILLKAIENSKKDLQIMLNMKIQEILNKR